MAIDKDLSLIAKALQIEHILIKASENHKWQKKQTEEAYIWYLRHWYLCIKYPSLPIASISKAADDLWHQHILDTRKYSVDCQKIAGMYLHHTPIYGEPSAYEAAAYKDTILLYENEFELLPSDLGQTSGDYSYRPPERKTEF